MQPYPRAALSEGSDDSGYVSNGTTQDGLLAKEAHCPEGVALPSSFSVFKRKRTKLTPFQREIPERFQHRFYDLREVFARPLYQHLTDCDVVFTAISLKVMVLGENYESAKPWIVVMCDETASKGVRRFFNMAHIKAQYQPLSDDTTTPSFNVLVCSRPPRPAAKRTLLTPNETPFAAPNLGPKLVYSQQIKSNTVCGAAVRVDEQARGRIATLGGIIKIERSDASYLLYSMTAGHVAMQKQPTGKEPIYSAIPSTTTEDPEIDDEEYYLDEEDFKPNPSDDIPQYKMNMALEFDQSSEMLSPASQGSCWPIGRISVTSQSSARDQDNLDWALIAFHDPFLYRPNMLTDERNQARLIRSASKEQQHVKGNISDCPVILLGGRSGLKRGRLSSNWSFLMMSPATRFGECRLLSLLDGSTVKSGDCGSWVIHETTNEVMGHIVASDVMSEAYMVPIQATFEDIKRQLGATLVSLPTLVDIERWLKKCTPWLSEFPAGVSFPPKSPLPPTSHTASLLPPPFSLATRLPKSGSKLLDKNQYVAEKRLPIRHAYTEPRTDATDAYPSQLRKKANNGPEKAQRYSSKLKSTRNAGRLGKTRRAHREAHNPDDEISDASTDSVDTLPSDVSSLRTHSTSATVYSDLYYYPTKDNPRSTRYTTEPWQARPESEKNVSIRPEPIQVAGHTFRRTSFLQPSQTVYGDQPNSRRGLRAPPPFVPLGFHIMPGGLPGPSYASPAPPQGFEIQIPGTNLSENTRQSLRISDRHSNHPERQVPCESPQGRDRRVSGYEDEWEQRYPRTDEAGIKEDRANQDSERVGGEQQQSTRRQRQSELEKAERQLRYFWGEPDRKHQKFRGEVRAESERRRRRDEGEDREQREQMLQEKELFEPRGQEDGITLQQIREERARNRSGTDRQEPTSTITH